MLYDSRKDSGGRETGIRNCGRRTNRCSEAGHQLTEHFLEIYNEILRYGGMPHTRRISPAAEQLRGKGEVEASAAEYPVWTPAETKGRAVVGLAPFWREAEVGEL